MRKISVGIIDYGVGNLASVKHCLQNLGMRCRISDDPLLLAESDLLLLPGVGAFPAAMQALKFKELDKFLVEQADRFKPILGICLGMQLLADASFEGGYTKGLGLIPGEVVQFPSRQWHIGWNTVEAHRAVDLFGSCENQAFYFNHSYIYRGAERFQVCKTNFGIDFASIIQRGKVVGIQFHPEKSQSAGHSLLKQVIHRLCDA